MGSLPPGTAVFQFRGGAATWFGTQILGVLITLVTLGICYPFAVVLVERWRAKNTFLLGRPMQFTGTGWGIFGPVDQVVPAVHHHAGHLLVLGVPAAERVENRKHGAGLTCGAVGRHVTRTMSARFESVPARLPDPKRSVYVAGSLPYVVCRRGGRARGSTGCRALGGVQAARGCAAGMEDPVAPGYLMRVHRCRLDDVGQPLDHHDAEVPGVVVPRGSARTAGSRVRHRSCRRRSTHPGGAPRSG